MYLQKPAIFAIWCLFVCLCMSVCLSHQVLFPLICSFLVLSCQYREQHGWEDDDYILAPGVADEYLIAKYSILYFDASLGFVVVGVLDYMNYPGFWSILFIFAGITGVISAALVEWDEWLSDIFNSISVHLFLFEALGLLYRHSRSTSSSASASASSSSLEEDANASSKFIRCLTLFGDVSFVFGAFGDVVLSYYSVMGNFDVLHAQIAVGCAFAWLLCSLIYVFVGINEEIQIRRIYYQHEQIMVTAMEEKGSAMKKQSK